MPRVPRWGVLGSKWEQRCWADCTGAWNARLDGRSTRTHTRWHPDGPRVVVIPTGLSRSAAG